MTAGTSVDPSSVQDSRRLRILIVTPSLPYPPIWGFGIRVNQLAKGLARHHDVALLTYAEAGEQEKIAALRALGVAVHTVPAQLTDARQKRMAQIRSLVSMQSFQRLSLFSAAMQKAIDALVASRPFDVIQIESSQLGGFAFDSRSVVVLDEHNIEYELLYRMYRTEGSLVRRVYNWAEYLKFKREEIRTWKTAAACVVTSDREQLIVNARVPDTPTIVGANAVDVDYFRPADAPGQPHRLAMTGLMHYRPNLDGAVFFIQQILPRILARRPDAVFYAVGAGAPDELKKLASANVVITDTVPDVRPYVHDAGIFVVPLRMGGGTRLKVLEGLSMRKAVVSTALGCEGIDVVDTRHLLIANEPAAFADVVLQLMSDSARREELGREGRSLVEERYTWDSVVARLEAFYHRLLAERSGGRRHGASG